MSTYYQDQLSKIQGNDLGFPAQIKLNKSGHKTHWLSLNDESATELVKWLKTHYNVSEPTKTFGGTWTTEDIKGRADCAFDVKLGECQALEIIDIIENNFDATIGVNWDIIDEAIEKYIKE